MAISLKQGKHTSGRTASRLRRQVRGRKAITGSTARPRLVVARAGNKYHGRVAALADGAREGGLAF